MPSNLKFEEDTLKVKLSIGVKQARQIIFALDKLAESKSIVEAKTIYTIGNGIQEAIDYAETMARNGVIE